MENTVRYPGAYLWSILSSSDRQRPLLYNFRWHVRKKELTSLIEATCINCNLSILVSLNHVCNGQLWMEHRKKDLTLLSRARVSIYSLCMYHLTMFAMEFTFKVARIYLFAHWLCFWSIFRQEWSNRFLWFLASLTNNGRTLRKRFLFSYRY